MQVAKWGNSLAVRIPQAVVEALKLKEGDQIEITIAGTRQFEIGRDRRRDEALKRVRALRWPLPEGFNSIERKRMNAKAFLDTNVIVYAFSSNDPRREQALALVTAGGIVSVQVLNEFVNVSRRKARREWTEIQEALALLKALLDTPQPITIAAP